MNLTILHTLSPRLRLCSALACASIVLLALSCTPALPPATYQQWFETHRDKLSSTLLRNGVRLVVCYLPAEIHAAREMQAFRQNSGSDTIMSNYTNTISFAVSVSSETGRNVSLLLDRDGLAGYGANVYHNSFRNTENIFLLHDRDTVKCAGYQFERGWGVSGGEDVFVVAFNKTDIKSDIKAYSLIMREITNELGTTTIKLGSIIKAVPALKDQ
jgi:hypothetical protein